MTPDPADRSPLAAAAEALPRMTPEQREELKQLLAAIPEAQWGATAEKSDAEHVSDFADTLRLTREEFPGDEPRALHGLYIAGTETVLLHTGTSPSSAARARALHILLMVAPSLLEADEQRAADAAWRARAVAAVAWAEAHAGRVKAHEAWCAVDPDTPRGKELGDEYRASITASDAARRRYEETCRG